MRLSQRAIVLAVAVMVAVTAATVSKGYHFRAVKWPGGVVPYYNAAPDQAWAVAQAVRAWNRSGAKVRFVAVPRAAAKLVIEEESDKVYCEEGHASLGDVAGARVVIFPARGLTHACNRYWAARVMTHELGHVLGLLHEDRYCATMNATGSFRGGRACEPRPAWDWRCRLLEPDDLAGAAAAYGGTARAPTQPALCPLYGAIARPRGLAAEYDSPTGAVVLSFQRPADPAIPDFVVPSPWPGRASFAVSGPLETCSSKDPAPTDHWRWHVAQRGAKETFRGPAAQGRNCYDVWAVDKLGRPSATPSTVIVSVT